MSFQFVFALWVAATPSADQPIPLELSPQNTMSLSGDRFDDLVVLSGERGYIFRSENRAETWEAISVPYTGLLTRVRFIDYQRVIALGHEASILKSNDGGKTWRLTYQRSGSDQPLFDLVVQGSKLVAVGAYGLVLESTDAGTSWVERDVDLDDEPHFYSVVSIDDELLMLGEFGQLIRMMPDNQWVQSNFDYRGSFFNLRKIGNELLAVGLQAQVRRSRDGGQTWSAVEIDEDRAIYGVIEGPDESVLLYGANGLFLRLTKGGDVHDLSFDQRMSITDVVRLSSTGFLLLGPKAYRWLREERGQ